MSESVQLSFLGSNSGGFLVVGRIINFWHMSHISTHSFSLFLFLVVSSLVFLFTPLSVVEQKEKETRMACQGLNRAEILLSNSHQPCVNPQGDRENSKHRSPAKTKKRTTVHPLTVACLLCEGPCWLSITPQHAGVAKQPR